MDLVEKLKTDIVKLQTDMETMPQVETPSFHHFTDGLYTRETHMPKGTLAIGEIHKYKVTNILIKGKISVFMGDEVKHIEAPCIFESEANVQKIAFFHEDTIWLNCHPTKETDINKIKDDVIAKRLLEEK